MAPRKTRQVEISVRDLNILNVLDKNWPVGTLNTLTAAKIYKTQEHLEAVMNEMLRMPTQSKQN